MAAMFRMMLRRLSTIASADVASSTRMLKVTWEGTENDERVGQFPVTWLRDNCRCGECYNAHAQMRLMHLKDLNPRISPTHVEVSDTKENLYVIWPDGHVSVFDSDWLQSRDFGLHGHQFRTTPDSPLDLASTLWGAEMGVDMRKYEYNDWMNDDTVLYDWTKTVEQIGIALIVNSPLKEGVIGEIGRRVGYLRYTHYGNEIRVEAKDTPNNIAYTPAPLALHIDLPYYNYVPGLQLFHCITQPDGMTAGENEFVDGFRVAEDLRAHHPDHFRLLSTVPVDYHDHGAEGELTFAMHHQRTPIELDSSGEAVVRIAVNDGTRDSLSHMPADMVQPMYDALCAFNKGCYDKRNILEYKLQQGDVIAFDNRRVMHGRKGYQIRAGFNSDRLIITSYIDWDQVKSRRRVLAEKFARA